jgi:RNA polymerase sigma-70 factor (ECF subfamily)
LGVKKKDQFIEIYDQYYPLTFSVVYSKTGNYDDAEDICQEVFVALYRKLDEVENPKKWIYGTLKNLVLKYYRDKKPEYSDIDTLFEDIGFGYVNGFRESRITIMNALDEEAKDEDDRKIVELISVYNFSYPEVALMMGLTKRKVEYRYRQLVKRITENLKKRGITSIEELL